MGWVLIVAGLALLGAEGWLVADGMPLPGFALIILTGVTLAVVISELRNDY